MTKVRCQWVNLNNPTYINYHDKVWGKKTTNNQELFRMLCLESFQAGLSWESILNRSKGFDDAFVGFEPHKCSQFTDKYLLSLLDDSGIIRNKAKIFAVRTNALALLKIQTEFGSFYNYIWGYVDFKQIVNAPISSTEVPAYTELSMGISKDLKRRGMIFVGPTIIYAYLQAIGVVIDHTSKCWLFRTSS